jgi:hypothetical protein
VGTLLDLGPTGGPVGDTAWRAPLLGEFVWRGAGPNLAMREGCIPGGGPLSGAGVEGCEEGTCRSANGGASLRPAGSRGILAWAGEGNAGSFLVFMVDPGAVKLRPPLAAGPLDARGPDGASGDGALLGPFSRPKLDSEGAASRLSLPEAREGSLASSRPLARDARGPVGVSCSDLGTWSRAVSCLPLVLLSEPPAVPDAGAVRSSFLAPLSRLRSLSPIGASVIKAARAGLMTGSTLAPEALWLASTLDADRESCCWPRGVLSGFKCVGLSGCGD